MTETSIVEVRNARWPEEAVALERLRETVFIAEQGVPKDIEWDGRDDDASHVIATLDGEAVGCGRLLPDGRIGRLAVLAAQRRKQIGARLLEALLRLAREQGMTDVYLHAQADAVAFYQRAGFQSRGEPFDEAGIAHQDMHLALDYRDCDFALTRLNYPLPFAQLVVAQARLARRELRVLSPMLDPAVFESEDLLDALRGLLRRSRNSRVQILIEDPRPIVQRGHGLLKLARRLPSSMEMRRLREHPAWEGDSAVIRDRDSLLALPVRNGKQGFYRPDDRARCESALNRFDMLWNVSEPDPELRALAL